MVDPVLLVSPIALLAAVLLVRFSGCTFDTSGLGTGWNYPGTVMSHPDLVAYWRLGEFAGTVANDLGIGPNDGTFTSEGLAEAPQSAAAPGTIMLGAVGLIASDAAHTSINVNGGYVEVPFVAALNPAQFSAEAWVAAEWAATDVLTDGRPPFRAVLSAREVVSGETRGFTIYAGPDSSTPADDTVYWQAWVGDGGANWQILLGPPVDLDQQTHLAITYDGTTLQLFVNGSEDETGTPDAEMTVGFSPNTGSPLYIGMGAPEAADPLFPFHGRIQEVALYAAALTAVVIDRDRVMPGMTTAP